MSGAASARDGWFGASQPEPGLYAIEEPLHVERVKSYPIVGKERALLLDSGMGVASLRSLVRGLTAAPVLLVTSHADWDHIGSHHEFVGEAEIAVHPTEAADLAAGYGQERLRRWFTPGQLLGPLPEQFDLAAAAIPPVTATRLLHGGERLELGGTELAVNHAPGHSPELLALVDEPNGRLFTADGACAGDLYAQLPGSDLHAYRATLSNLAAMAPSFRAIYAAHGERPLQPRQLAAMRDAFDQVLAGRRPESHGAGVAAHAFDGFHLLIGSDPDQGDAQ